MHPRPTQLSFADQLCVLASNTLKTLFAKPLATRSNPATSTNVALTEAERKHSAGLMRVNHVGEVCAQALYQGQALTARSAKTQAAMAQSAVEEEDHLAWCAERLAELNSHPSYLNVIWYLGSLTLGIIAGIAGDRWSLGFVAETEAQVIKHLDSHFAKLPEQDQRSREIISQMRTDEAKHQQMALAHGGEQLPIAVRELMAAMAKIMTSTAYYV